MMESDFVSKENHVSALLELAARCEREEPSRRLDGDIGYAIHNARSPGTVVRDNRTGTLGINLFGSPLEPVWERYDPPLYTGSVDHAIRLIPYGWLIVTLSDIAGDGLSFCKLANTETPVKEAISFGCKTRALDICAAALKARAAIAEQEQASTKRYEVGQNTPASAKSEGGDHG